jgi:hypothetical protein
MCLGGSLFGVFYAAASGAVYKYDPPAPGSFSTAMQSLATRQSAWWIGVGSWR